MKKICFITGTRADYGIMAPIMRKVKESPEVQLQIIATNMHLSPRYGMTVREMEGDGFHVDVKIASLTGDDSPGSILRSMARIEEGLAEAFEGLSPDIVVVLGDRYEALAAASAALIFRIPIVHLHGGEITEGAIDDSIRHAITKLSTYHFASTPEYTERIISMGENPENVFHCGAPGAEVKVETDKKTEEGFYIKTGFRSDDKFILMAFHPATLSEDGSLKEVLETIAALQSFINKGYKILVTLPNSDPGNLRIRALMENLEKECPGKVKCVESLGARLFHYAMLKAAALIGNSSAALIEAPSLKLPAVNIGIRQKGRSQGPTVVNADGLKEEVIRALEKVLSPEFKNQLQNMSLEEINPYYKKNSVDKIFRTMMQL